MQEIMQLLCVFQVKDREVENMAILLTNGKYYITHSTSGAVIKVQDIGQAQNFYSVERAIHQKNKAPGKCAGYYLIDTDILDAIEHEEKSIPKKKSKRKQFSKSMRRNIYEKTQGYCYLCGKFVKFNSFEVEHKTPLSKGGTNDLSNLYCSCHKCNKLKRNIYYEDFMEKISQIFLYQMQMQYGNSLRWKFLNRALSKMM